MSFRVASQAHRNSCATPMATTPGRPARSAASRYGRITSIFRSPLANRIHGMALASAYRAIACRNAAPFLPSAAGEGIGNPR